MGRRFEWFFNVYWDALNKPQDSFNGYSKHLEAVLLLFKLSWDGLNKFIQKVSGHIQKSLKPSQESLNESFKSVLRWFDF